MYVVRLALWGIISVWGGLSWASSDAIEVVTVTQSLENSSDSSAISPYTLDAQEKRSDAIIDDYFKSRKTPGEVFISIRENGDQYKDDSLQTPDGDDLEQFTMPTPVDAETPMDPASRERQESLERDLVTAGEIDDFVNTADDFMQEPGGPDTMAELSDRIQDERGESIRPELDIEQAKLFTYPVLP